MNLEFIKPQNLGPLLMKLSQSNFNLRLPGSYLVRSYLITTVCLFNIIVLKLWIIQVLPLIFPILKFNISYISR